MTRRTKRYAAAASGTVLGGLTLVFSGTALSDPSLNSIAEVAGCLTAESEVLACSSKELSNVVIECTDGETTSYFKYDDLAFEEDNPYFVLLDSPYQGAFPCPEGAGDPVAAFIKSGSAKTPKGQISLLPPGSGLIVELGVCPEELTELCPAPSTDDEEEEDEETPEETF